MPKMCVPDRLSYIFVEGKKPLNAFARADEERMCATAPLLRQLRAHMLPYPHVSLVIPAQAGIQSGTLCAAHKINVECFARHIQTGFRPAPE
jgi:hypothetical protein